MLCSFPDEDLVFKYAPWALNKNEALAATVSDNMSYTHTRTMLVTFIYIICAYIVCMYIGNKIHLLCIVFHVIQWFDFSDIY